MLRECETFFGGPVLKGGKIKHPPGLGGMVGVHFDEAQVSISFFPEGVAGWFTFLDTPPSADMFSRSRKRGSQRGSSGGSTEL